MMNHDMRPIRFIVAGLVILGLLVAGSAAQRSAWTEGYTMGLLTSGADSSDLAPYLLYRTGPGSHAGGGFFGGIVRLGFLLLVVAGLFKLLGFAYWRRHDGPPPWMHKYGPCWGREEDGPAASSTGTAQSAPVAPEGPAPVSG
ncbi:MAG: hypothetical protein ACK2UO_11960 [Caldilineaceae bacterium]